MKGYLLALQLSLTLLHSELSDITTSSRFYSYKISFSILCFSSPPTPQQDFEVSTLLPAQGLLTSEKKLFTWARVVKTY